MRRRLAEFGPIAAVAAAAPKVHVKVSDADADLQTATRLVNFFPAVLYADEDEMPDQLVKDEIRRMTTEISKAKNVLEARQLDIGPLDTWFSQLVAAMRRPDETYLKADQATRRKLNQFWFEHIDIWDDEISGDEYADFTQFVMQPELPRQMRKATQELRGVKARDAWDDFIRGLRNEEPLAGFETRGSDVNVLVGVPE